MESNDHVNAPPTPNKVLQQVTPIPQIPKATYSRRKQTAAVLTEADFIKENKTSSDDDSFLPCCNGESEFSDENECGMLGTVSGN
jgi:hypothetical protein